MGLPASRFRSFAFLTSDDPASLQADMAHQHGTRLFIDGLPGSAILESMCKVDAHFRREVDMTGVPNRKMGRGSGSDSATVEIVALKGYYIVSMSLLMLQGALKRTNTWAAFPATKKTANKKNIPTNSAVTAPNTANTKTGRAKLHGLDVIDIDYGD
ncbi:hypothetical protein GSI_08860 [Ganoderma sinense ZZ0214-1]|uniref:Uncharacterized protein n=1 Tax=Ganoderma sinense ZZ0214-1 TaxID=1077348 RepID=A0A2G8S4Z3_9APHY|nr:hypothetical protein GSI_08860 [Ganoderma sinense ZZ0214-1]